MKVAPILIVCFLLSGCSLMVTMDDVPLSDWFDVSEGDSLDTHSLSLVRKCEEIQYLCLYAESDEDIPESEIVHRLGKGENVKFVAGKLRGNVFWVYPYASVDIGVLGHSKEILVGSNEYHAIFKNQ